MFFFQSYELEWDYYSVEDTQKHPFHLAESVGSVSELHIGYHKDIGYHEA